MSDTRQRYDELIIDRAWDNERQTQLILEYVDEFKLSDHFLSYLGIKPASSPDKLVPSVNYSLSQLIQMVIKSDKITAYIQDNVPLVKTDEPWDIPSMIKCVARGLSIEIDPTNEQLVQELLTYFNYRHTSLRKAMGESNTEKANIKEDNYLGKLLGSYINKEKPSEAESDDYFDGMLTRFASLGSGGKTKRK